MKIAILGAGNMGLSFSKSFLKYELIKPENLHLITRSQTKISKIAEEFPKSKLPLLMKLQNWMRIYYHCCKTSGFSDGCPKFQIYFKRKPDGFIHYGRDQY
jgi:pyrroline-5-carboxylate reductase